MIACRVDRFHLRPEDGWRLDTERLAATVAAGDYELVVVVNPNNPTGRLTPADDLHRAIEASPANTRWWVDEAYLGYVGFPESLAALAPTEPRLVVCTSLSKMYALSGLRAAYLVADPGTAAALRRLTPPWQVSLPAQIAAVTALRDPEHYRAAWARTRVLREQLRARLAALDGLEVEDSVANFLCLTLPRSGLSAPAFVTALREHDVYLRDLSPLSPSYEGRTVRVAVRDEAENARIVAACSEVLGV